LYQDEASNTFQGFIRVHMNLIRPINMSLSARPPSIYEVLSHEAPKPEDHDSQLTSFHLPKDTTKVIHILR
jgi:Ras association domain-containing protein 1